MDKQETETTTGTVEEYVVEDEDTQPLILESGLTPPQHHQPKLTSDLY